MRHLSENTRSVFALLLVGAFLLLGTLYSGSVKESATDNAGQYAQGFQSGGVMLADDWECNDFI